MESTQRPLRWHSPLLPLLQTPTVRNFVHAHGGLKGFLQHHEADIACFQETKLPSLDKLTKDLACVQGFESFWAVSREKKGYSGTVSYVKDEWSPTAAEVDCLGSGDEDIDREGYHVVLAYEFCLWRSHLTEAMVVLSDHGAFVLINVYAPNAGPAPERPRAAYKCKFLQALHSKAVQLRDAGRQVLIVGDLNIAARQQDVHDKLDREAMYSAHEKSLFDSLLADFTDVWRQQHPATTNSFTVWDEKTNARAFNEGVRIDYALCSPGLLKHVVSCDILTLPPKWSDHAAVILELKDLEAPAKHSPCALSSACMQRFNDRKQPSIASMFSRKPAKPAAALEEQNKKRKASDIL